jgi:hypothetical protein
MNRIGYVLLLGVFVGACSSGASKAASPSTTYPAGSTATSTLLPTRSDSPAATTPNRCPNSARKYTQAQLAALRPAVDRMVKGSISSVGTEVHAIGVNLLPGREALAGALETRFGNAVAITVGLAPYHCGDGASRRCPSLQGTDNLPPGLHLTLRLGALSMRATASVNGQLLVREDTSTPLGMDPGQPLIGMIVKPGTRTVVGMYGGGVAGTGLGLNLHDGQQTAIRTIVAAWRCDGMPGSTLPPGRYGARAGISRNEGPAEYLAPEVPLTITHELDIGGIRTQSREWLTDTRVGWRCRSRAGRQFCTVTYVRFVAGDTKLARS